MTWYLKMNFICTTFNLLIHTNTKCAELELRELKIMFHYIIMCYIMTDKPLES